MKLAITGPLGHIGSRFIHSLRPGDFEEVLLVDDMSAQRYCSLFELPKGVKFRLVEADVTNPAVDLTGLLAGFDVVIHLAAITNAAASFEVQKDVERVNFTGTERVAEACLATGARLLFPSTTSVYGTQAEVVDESCTIDELKPQSPYAESKLRAEGLLQQLARDKGLRTVICRFGTIFGISKGMRFHTAVNKFIWQACHGQPLTVWRTALHQKRPYLDVEDCVRSIRFIVDHDLFDGEIYNVLTINATVDEIVSTIRRHVPDLGINFVDSKIMNQLSYTVGDAKFRAKGFAPAGDLARGVHDT
ncbi:MAG TPA: SDR family oxidoreductase, partial [Kofleriaceae bacterium]|nr:SDR family oxidoreductase [Kofleriaceae bacterium]